MANPLKSRWGFEPVVSRGRQVSLAILQTAGRSGLICFFVWMASLPSGIYETAITTAGRFFQAALHSRPLSKEGQRGRKLEGSISHGGEGISLQQGKRSPRRPNVGIRQFSECATFDIKQDDHAMTVAD